MFRSDRDALAQQVDDLRDEQERLRLENEAMRRELLVRRRTAPAVASTVSVYKAGVAHLSPGERAALAHHTLRSFPPWAAVLLHFVTFGIFPLIHFNLSHDRLPQAERDDPSAGKGIGFSLIPYLNLYWVVFNTLRLTDRINLQYRLRGLPDALPRPFMAVAGVISVIPYLNILLAWTVFWPIAIVFMQRAVNRLAAENESKGTTQVATAGLRIEPPAVRVPLVADLPGPDPAVEQLAEEEASETATLRERR